MVTCIVDTSVLIKWFHAEGETELEAARALYQAHERGSSTSAILDLAIYEIGNFLGRRAALTDAAVAGVLADVIAICGTPVTLDADARHDAIAIMRAHGVSFYDASWAAAARALDVPLVSADQQLLTTGLAESVTTHVERYLT